MSTIWKPHVTVAAIAEREGKLLLVEESIDNKLVLNQPAGHLDDNESLIDAVIRESKEETAYDFIPENLVGIYRWRSLERNRTYIRFAFCGKAVNHDPDQQLDDGIVRALWLTPDEIIEQKNRWRTAMVGQVFDDYLSGRRYPIDLLNEVLVDNA